MTCSTALLVLISLISFSPILSSPQETNKINGFTTRLIHRYSPRSPIYNPNFTPSDRLHEMFNHTVSRHSHLKGGLRTTRAAPDDVMAPVRGRSNGAYIMQYSIGTPPTPTWGFVDTGSDIIWLQCLPCQNCYPQMGSIWDPRNSSTYRKIECNEDQTCNYYSDASNCLSEDNFCHFGLSYFDHSNANGYLSMETLTFRDQESKGGAPINLSNMIFGCGINNSNTVEGDITPGVVGLNTENVSLISQLSFNGFSYCFAPMDSEVDSPLHLGTLASYEGVRVPILDVGDPSFYYLGLQCISIDGECLPVPPETFNSTEVVRGGSWEWEGGFIIDSGTSMTELNPYVFELLRQRMIEKIKGLDQVDTQDEYLELCYKASLTEIQQKTPNITLHFSDEAALTLSASNMWIADGRRLSCLGIVPADNTNLVSILGSNLQVNINVGYNLEERFVSFKPMDCTTVGL